MPTAVQGPEVDGARSPLWRVRGRRAVQQVRSHGRRVRRGPLTVTWLAPAPGAPTVPPSAAFAIGKAIGGAVVRNRVRRRLRAALRQLLVEGRLPSGTYLIGGTAAVATLPWSVLVDELATAIAEAQA